MTRCGNNATWCEKYATFVGKSEMVLGKKCIIKQAYSLGSRDSDRCTASHCGNSNLKFMCSSLTLTLTAFLGRTYTTSRFI